MSDFIGFLLVLKHIFTQWLKTIQGYYNPGRLKSAVGPTGQTLVGGSRGESVVLPFPFSINHPHSLAHDLLSSLKPAVASWVFLIRHHLETDASASIFSYKDPCRHTQAIQADLLDLTSLGKSLLLCKITHP